MVRTVCFLPSGPSSNKGSKVPAPKNKRFSGARSEFRQTVLPLILACVERTASHAAQKFAAVIGVGGRVWKAILGEAVLGIVQNDLRCERPVGTPRKVRR